jgi:ubiquinone/menaquinone biosynthesis C-methylase UbiE
MDQPDLALAEFRRVLAPGGVLIIPTFLHGTGWFRRALSRLLSLVSSFVAHTRFDLVGLEACITAAGFEVVDSEQMSGLFPIGYVSANLVV